MKLTTLFSIISFFSMLANTGYTQTITLNVEDAPISKIIDRIEATTEYRFVYNTKFVDLKRKVSIKAEDVNIENVLNDLFKKTSTSYKIINTQIVLKDKKEINTQSISEVSALNIQQYSIKGYITDINGQPLAGANIIEKGTINGAQSDFDGNYSLKVSNPNTTIVVSYVGFITKEVAINNQTDVNVSLLESAGVLDEVVVIGYGTVKKRDLTGAVSSVRSKEIGMSPVVSPIEAIQGRVAGLDITRNDGRAGSGFSILLRGNRSLQTDSEPVYIIDGIQGNINNLNPNDIASIDVLKDASSTAIYGISGANGVIIITTKKGEKGKIQVDFNSYISINSNPSYPSPLQGDAWLDYLREGYIASGLPTPDDRDAVLTGWGLNPSELNPYIDSSKYVDWADQTFRTGIQINNTLSIRGGNEKIQGSFSMGHNKTEGIYPGDDINVYTMRSDVNIQAAKWVKFGITTGLIYKDRNQNRSRVNKAFGLVPLGDVYNADGQINLYPTGNGQDIGEPSVLANNIPGTYLNSDKSTIITANPYIDFTLAKGLTLKSILGVTLSNSRFGEYESNHTYYKLTGSSAEERTARYNTGLGYGYNWENILNYETAIGDNHNFGATFITSYAYNQSEKSESSGAGFTSDKSLWYNLKAAPAHFLNTFYEMGKRSSYAGRLNYNYKGKYFITGSVRADGVTELTKGNEWDVFPAGAIAWRISDEDFMSEANWLSDLKLRIGYGVSGSRNIDPYTSLSGVTDTAPDLLDLGGGQVQTFIPTEFVGNDNLGWEKSYNMNIGIDFGLLRNRIYGAIEYYDTDSKDLIWDRPLPSTVGGVGPKTTFSQNANLAAMNNKGIELTLNSTNIRTKDFQWSTTLTFAKNTEKVTQVDLGNVEVEDLVALNLFIGHQRGVFYDYKKMGIWQLGEEADAAVFGLEPGDVKIESTLTRQSEGVWTRTVTDSEGVTTEETYTASDRYAISDQDKQIIGHKAPDWTAGLQNTFVYKAFDLSIFATARYGQMIDGELLGYMKYGSRNIPDIYNYWTPTNPTNDFPRPYISRSTSDSEPVQGLSIVDGSYFKIKNITLGYTLPEHLTSKIGLTNLRVYGTVYNSLIIAKSHLLDGLDPESGASDSFPLYKQMVFGLNVSF
nr:TonB-dependent receptor [Mariniflexile sp. KMM 9835]MDQ8210574.1 TonB-dependent receptor [Mariniflexile sp. KMM 9835]